MLLDLSHSHATSLQVLRGLWAYGTSKAIIHEVKLPNRKAFSIVGLRQLGLSICDDT
jgi:hypothetical protein